MSGPRPADVTPSRIAALRAPVPAAETKVLPDPDLGRCGSTSPRATLQKTPSHAIPEDGMKLSRNDLVQLLHSQGANATADRVATELQEEIDTDRDRELLAKVGLTHDQLMGRLASASIRTSAEPTQPRPAQPDSIARQGTRSADRSGRRVQHERAVAHGHGRGRPRAHPRQGPGEPRGVRRSRTAQPHPPGLHRHHAQRRPAGRCPGPRETKYSSRRSSRYSSWPPMPS